MEFEMFVKDVIRFTTGQIKYGRQRRKRRDRISDCREEIACSQL